VDTNLIHIKEVMSKYPDEVSSILELCPKFDIILAHMLVFRLGVRVQEVDWTSDMKDWDEEDCRRVGRSMATVMRMVQTGLMAVDAWKKHYVQLNILFDEIEGFEDFIIVIANNLLRDNKFGMVFRVSVGAVLSTIDAATDIYVISTYYQSGELYGQANAMLTMLLVNIIVQLLTVYVQYKKKSWLTIGKEALISMAFLRPAVDAYRVSTNHDDKEVSMDQLTEMVMNKGIELSCESIPGCVLQLYVWLKNPETAGTYALVSIGISCLTTGFASAMISFDMDVDVPRRKAQPKFYGYIPNDNSLRGMCFILMTLMSSLHNLSRSLAFALLATANVEMVLLFIGGEIGLYLVFKILRQDIHYWAPGTPLIGSFIARIVVKVVADFTGCLHLRHPYELGGLGFTMSMIWAQAFPFVALQYFDGDSKDIMTGFLGTSFTAWLVLNIIFFCTIDLSYLNTFFGSMTAAQYTCELYLTGQDDFQKFDAIFTNRIQYTKSIHGEVKLWVAENIDGWRRETPDWFKIEMIPDEFLPKDVIEAEGGLKRRRSSMSLREVFDLDTARKTGSRIVPAVEAAVQKIENEVTLVRDKGGSIKSAKAPTSIKSETSEQIQQVVELWRELAAEVYEVRSNSYKSNFIHVKRIFAEKEEIVRELIDRCPKFRVILSHILEDKFGWRVQKVDWTSEMNDWGLEECHRVGCSLATFLRKRKTGEHAIDAWRLHYVQMDVLFKEVVGFEEFMLVIANNTLRDSIYGMVYRVTVGAVLSTVDAATDIYVIATYYKSEELYGQANAMLAMLLGNLIVQLVVVYTQYRRKSLLVIGKETLITMLFLRPAVDAYRVSTNHEDKEVNMDQLSEMVVNKAIELGCESIPGCVLQLYVWLKNPEKAGTYALVSIGISCLTTGFASAMIAFDMDVDVPHRKNQPKFYGYIPNDNSLRGRCFVLMTLISSLHNLSRSLGCALLAFSDPDKVLHFIGGEIGLYLVFKILRQDFHFWVPGIPLVASFFERFFAKVIVDFTGCLHFRHPYELGGLGFTISMIWAQAFPFVALQYFDGDSKDIMKGFLVVSFSAWLVLNIIFFCTIDLSYLNTFFGTKTAPQYTCELYSTSNDDYAKFDTVFGTRIEYTKSIHEEVKEWVAANIDKWKRETPDWFNTEIIPDEFLPKDVFEAEGGAKRRRSSVSLMEIVGLGEASVGRVHPEVGEEMKVEDL